MAKKSIEKNTTELEKLHADYLELKLKETHKLAEARKDIARLKTAMNNKLEVAKGE